VAAARTCPPKGVALARAIGAGAELGSVAYVVTSASPRAVETAIAMGLAVGETVDLPSGYVPGEVQFHQQWAWARPYVRYAGLIARGGGLARVAKAHRAVWIGAVEQVDQGEAALLVGHGGAIEPALVACLLGADHQRWDGLFGHCDGARLGVRQWRVPRRRVPQSACLAIRVTPHKTFDQPGSKKGSVAPVVDTACGPGGWPSR
jgi:broad specificity phosphatase PhoE